MRSHVVAWLAQYLPMSVAQLLAPTWFTMVGVAGLVTVLLLLRHARRDHVDRGAVATAVITTYLTAIAGGVAIPVLIELGSTGRLWFVGMTSYWGYLVGTIAMVETCRRVKVPLGWMADRITPALGVSLALIRVGCFLAGCDYGQISSVPWAVRFPRGSSAWRDHVAQGLVPAARDASLPVHPTQLYEAALGVVIALVAWRYNRRAARIGSGRTFVAAAAAYCVGRLGVENLRGDGVRGFVGGLSSGQLFALAVLAAIAVAAVRARRTPPPLAG
ncbi:MAG: prolipoprotein diacylglyceryl transferase [Myxococcales bacterium]|nr:prolipoprotein diacylglyceryl transferase [Myxococcales bacterium]